MEYDPFDASVTEDLYAVYDWLRDEAPVHYAPDTAAYVLSRYEDVLWALGEVDLFSSDAMRGVLLGQATGTGTERLPREDATGMLVSVDAPGHTELRRIVNRGFTPRRITSWHERIAELVTTFVDKAEAGRPFDVISGLAAPLPVRVIAELLGGDAEEADNFRVWADTLTGMISGSARKDGVSPAAADAAFNLALYLAGRIEERQREPQDDLLTTIVRAHGEDTLSLNEAVGFAALLLFAGTETSTNLIGNATWALLRHPDELDKLIADPTRINAVLEETLRWEAPVQYVFRRATRSFERHGVEIPVDANVTLVLGAANRDPRHWGEDADRFVPDRPLGGHVGFGFGPHFCLGAALARAEGASALEQLLPILDGAEVTDPGDSYIDSCQFRGRRKIELVPA